MYFLNARYYIAGIGRFLTKDTVKDRANDPKSLNLYAYAHGNPVSFVHPVIGIPQAGFSLMYTRIIGRFSPGSFAGPIVPHF